MGGKVSSDLQEIIRKRPRLFANLIRELKDVPDHAILRVVREEQSKKSTKSVKSMQPDKAEARNKGGRPAIVIDVKELEKLAGLQWHLR